MSVRSCSLEEVRAYVIIPEGDEEVKTPPSIYHLSHLGKIPPREPLEARVVKTIHSL